MQIHELLTPHNREVKSSRKIMYLVLHYVGALGGAEANCKYYASKYIGASAHYYVGHAGEVWRSVAEKDIAWHCGAKKYVHTNCRNSNSIGIEMCVRKKNTSSMSASDKDWYFEQATIDSTIALVKELMEKYDIPVENVIRHYDVTGKTCPAPYVHDENAWRAFKNKLVEQTTVKEITTNNKFPKTPFTVNVKITDLNYRSKPSMQGVVKGQTGKGTFTITEVSNGWGRLKSGVGWIYLENPNYLTIGNSIESPQPAAASQYKVKVTADALNIRKGPGTNYAVVGCIRDKGVYTIVQESNGWGKLLSGAGWISLSYCKKV